MVTKKHKSPADFILMAWLIIFGIHLLAFYIFFTGQQFDYPLFAGLGMSLPLVHGPFLYLYTYQQTSSKPFQLRQLFHFLPLFLSYLLFSRFFLMTHEQQAQVFRDAGSDFQVESAINLYAIYLSGIVYVALSLIRLLKYRRKMVQQFSNTERINFNWLLYLIIWMVIIWTVILFMRDDNLIFGAASLFVLWIGYFGIRQVQVFTQRPAPQVTVPSDPVPVAPAETDGETVIPTQPAGQVKYQKSSLSPDEAASIHARLRQLMEEKKPFKDPDLTLDDLAEQLDVHPNHLSQVINSREHKSFYDLINEQRVQDFIKHVTRDESQQFTMLAIALDSGFNSKASFNRNFKKYTGHTPSDYLKLQTVE